MGLFQLSPCIYKLSDPGQLGVSVLSHSPFMCPARASLHNGGQNMHMALKSHFPQALKRKLKVEDWNWLSIFLLLGQPGFKMKDPYRVNEHWQTRTIRDHQGTMSFHLYSIYTHIITSMAKY